jgi:hypothetical protein
MYYTFTNQRLTFVLEGGEQVAALKAKVSIEKSTIETVSFHDVFSDWHSMMVRMPGSYMPRLIMAGSYWTDEGWDFVYAHKPRGLRVPMLRNVLVISTSQDKYKRIIIETSKEKADEIIRWWNEK